MASNYHYTDYYQTKDRTIATPLTFDTPEDLLTRITAQCRALRLQANLTQAGLARRAGVPYATLRAFERTGRISLLSFVKLAQALNRDSQLLAALELGAAPYRSIQDVVAAASKPKRKRGSIT